MTGASKQGIEQPTVHQIVRPANGDAPRGRLFLLRTLIVLAGFAGLGSTNAAEVPGENSSPPGEVTRAAAIAGLQANPKVSRIIVSEFARGTAASDVFLVLRGRADNLFFYRPVVDDSPADIARARANVRAHLGRLGLASSGPDTSRALKVRATPAAALDLAANGYVHAIATTVQYEPQVANAVENARIPPLFGHPYSVWGAGVKVAVIDQTFHPENLPGVIVEEQCFCTRANGTGCCPNGINRQSGAGAAQRVIPDFNQNNHGTSVASVIKQPNFVGGAPGAQVVALSVDFGMDGVKRALEFLTTRGDIAVVNFSARSTVHPGVCDSDPDASLLLPALATLREQGVNFFASTGNDALNGAIGAPACLSPAIAVTGTWNCDYEEPDPGEPPPQGCASPIAATNRIWDSANTGPKMDIATTSEPISVVSPPLAGNPTNGTSFSAPLAASCAAVLRQAFPALRTETLRSALQASPTLSTTPARPGVSVRLLDCVASFNHLKSAAGVNLNQHGLTGTWYEPATAGQGFVFEVAPNLNQIGTGLMFGGWFTFEGAPAGGAERNRWYTLSGEVTNSNRLATLWIYQNGGGNFNAPPITEAGSPVGSALVHFDNCAEGGLRYTFNDGRTGEIPLRRITPNVSCHPNGGGSGHPDFGLSGSWFNPATSGQGFILEVNPNQPFFGATWYTYAPASHPGSGVARQRWYTIQAAPGQYTVGSRTVSNMPIYLTTGGLFDVPSSVTNTPVGTATIAFDPFNPCYNATLTYNFTGGLSPTAPIEPFRDRRNGARR